MKKLIALFSGIILMAGVANAAENEPVMLESIDSAALAELMTQATASLDNYQELYNLFVLEKAKFFKSEDLVTIASQIKTMTESQMLLVSKANYFDPTINLVVSILVGGLGVDRFIIGDVGAGIGKLLTAGGLGIWWFVDLFLIQNATKNHNYELFDKAATVAKVL